MRFSDSFLDEIRDRVPISQVIGTRVSWDRKKTNAPRGDYWACCPFHGEKSPSFHCEDKKGRYHCFGCSVSGDHFRFLTELDGMSFPEAVERIAGMAGVPMPARDADAEKRDQERATLTDVMEMATQFFQDQLQSAAGAKARAYLRDRGLSSATQQSFRLGYASDSRNALKEFLAGKAVTKAQLETCGLVIHGDDIPVSFDRFRDRVMFPIPDSRGRIIAFGGRALTSDALAKYLNSPETELFHKGNVLYNYVRARKAMQKDGTVIAVEGYMDVIALAQAGFENVIAPMGTALTENQLELIWRMSGEPVLCFDGDQAGLKAAWRAADMALPLIQAGRTLRFALLPEGKDPDDLVKADGPDAFRAVLNEARPLADLLWMRETSGGVFDTPERRADLEKTLRELASRIRDESVRYHYQQEMRDRVHAFFGAQRSRPFDKGKFQQGDKRGGPVQGGQWARGGAAAGRLAISESLARSAMVKRAGSVMPLREAAIVVALVNHPALIEEYFDQVESLELVHSDVAQLHAVLIDVVAHHLTHERVDMIHAIENQGLAVVWERSVAVVRRVRMWPILDAAALEDARQVFVQLLQLHARSRELMGQKNIVEAALREATDSDQDVASTLAALGQINAELASLERLDALIDGFGRQSGRIAV